MITRLIPSSHLKVINLYVTKLLFMIELYVDSSPLGLKSSFLRFPYWRFHLGFLTEVRKFHEDVAKLCNSCPSYIKAESYEGCDVHWFKSDRYLNRWQLFYCMEVFGLCWYFSWLSWPSRFLELAFKIVQNLSSGVQFLVERQLWLK